MKYYNKPTYKIILIALLFSCNRINQYNPKAFTQSVDTSAIITQKLNELFLTSDSVVALYHKTTYGPVFDSNSNKYTDAARLVENNKLNKKSILRSKIIRGKDLNEIAGLLSKPITGNAPPIAACFDPHHAFLIFKKKEISFIEICFTCGGIAVSKGIPLDSKDFDELKWNSLNNYFKKHGL